MQLYGGIEAGGTSIRCASGTTDGSVHLLRAQTFPTRTPGETLPDILNFFAAQAPETPALKAIGVAAFGPVQINPQLLGYGEILNTPKLPWQGFSWPQALAGLGLPVCVDTDVNCAARAELKVAQVSSLAYMTVGTGIGMGYAGVSMQGFGHAEFGHQRVQRHPRDNFQGVCPFHGDCLEGLANGPALAQRWGSPAQDITTPEAWEIQAYYLAQACLNLLRLLPVERLVVGGGVLARENLLTEVCTQVDQLTGGYAQFGLPFAQRIQPPQLDLSSGLHGALELAAEIH